MKKLQKVKREKAITIPALVITIIVLLILASITIATLNGDNGILEKTGETKVESFTRGGVYSNKDTSGIFFSGNDSGATNSTHSFRIALAF